MPYKKPHFVIVILIMVWLSLAAFSTAMAQRSAQLVLVNYAEVGDQDNRNQAVNVYFTLLDDDGKAVVAPTIDEVSLNLGGNTYLGNVSIPQTPLYITLVLDTSGSMSPGAEQLRQAARQAVSAASDGTYFSLYRFNQTITLIEGFTSDKNRQINNILSIPNAEFDGGTCLYDAIFSAIELSQSSAIAGRRAVIVFTDGRDELIAGGELDQCSQHSLGDVIGAARDRSVRVPIFTIGLQGTQQVNFTELERIASDTGGVAETGALDEIGAAFQQVIQTLTSQRQATFAVCLPSNTYSGAMTVDRSLTYVVSGIKLTTDCEIPVATPTQTGTPDPTPTHTPVPLSIALENFRFDPDSNSIVFSIATQGDGDVAGFEVTIQNKRTLIQVGGDYGQFRVLSRDSDEVAIPLNQVTTIDWLICVKAYDSDDTKFPVTQCQEITPDRTPTPSPTPTATLTSTPTETPTPTLTPVPPPTSTPFIELPSVNYLPGDNQFHIVDIRAENLSLDRITAYKITVLQNNNARTEVFSQTNNTPPSFPLTFTAEDSAKQPLSPGEYIVQLEFTTQSGDHIKSPEDVVLIPLLPSPTPMGFLETAATAIRNNPIVAIVFGAALLLVILLLILLVLRNRGDGRNDGPPEYAPIPKSPQGGGVPDDGTMTQIQANQGIDTLSSLGATLHLTASGSNLDQKGRTWQFNNSQLPYRIGRGGSKDYPVKLHLEDNGVSGLHATIGFENGQYWIMDEGSRNGTFINGEPAPSGRRQNLLSGDRIRLGQQTEFEFRDNKKELIDRATTGKILTPPITQPAPGRINSLLDDDAPTEVEALIPMLPPDVTAKLDVASGMGTVPGSIVIQTREFTIGRRQSTNMLAIDNPGISRNHAKLEWNNGVFQFQNLSNNAGATRLDSIDLSPGAEAVTLEANTVHTIELGQGEKQVQLRFQYSVPPPPPPDTFEDEPTTV